MADPKRKSGGSWVLLIGIIAVIAYCNRSPDSPAPSPTAGTSTTTAPPATRVRGGDDATSGPKRAYALDPRRDTWPPLVEGASGRIDFAGVSASNYYVVLDGSGSMRERECSGNTDKIRAAIAALERFVSVVPESANLGLAVFDANGTSERVPLARGNRPAFRTALKKVRADGGTPLRSAIELGYQHLLEQARGQLGYGDYHLVVVTDGVPEPESENPERQVQAILDDSPVVLHTIGFCIGQDHVLNQAGRSFYVAADTPEQLQQGLGDVLAESPSFDIGSFTP